MAAQRPSVILRIEIHFDDRCMLFSFCSSVVPARTLTDVGAHRGTAAAVGTTCGGCRCPCMTPTIGEPQLGPREDRVDFWWNCRPLRPRPAVTEQCSTGNSMYVTSP